MRTLLIIVGSIVVSSAFGLAGARFGLMTSYILGTIGGGVGMYAGRALAIRLGA
jgi:hypothetical protein